VAGTVRNYWEELEVQLCGFYSIGLYKNVMGEYGLGLSGSGLKLLLVPVLVVATLLKTAVKVTLSHKKSRFFKF
jgi:hypothetical protein